MTMIGIGTDQRRREPPTTALVVARKAKPVKWFAGFGAACIALQAYVFARWILSGNATPTANGPDPMPGIMRVAAHSFEVIGLILTLVCGYFLVIKPRRRDGHLSLYGLAFFAVFTAYWLDAACNFAQHVFTVNPAFVNFGAWYNFIPGWRSPRAEHIAEPILFLAPAYTYAIVLPAVGITALMGITRRRWPQLGNVGLLSLMVGVAALGLLIFEGMLFVRSGLYVLAGTIPSLTLWSGRYYQYPIYEPIVGGIFLVIPATCFYFRNDKGETLIERGLTNMRLTERQSRGLRFLALSGLFNLMQVFYAVVFGLISILPSFQWATDIVQKRSYLRNELCGVGTPYACPAPDVPIPRQGGAHVAPDGSLVTPPN